VPSIQPFGDRGPAVVCCITSRNIRSLEALAMPADQLEKIDVLLSDVVMPRMGGAELARRLRSERPDLKVLFVSGYPREHGREDATSISHECFLQKPFTEGDLIDKLRDVLDG
jgi:CheY-like chemotaxis protein